MKTKIVVLVCFVLVFMIGRFVGQFTKPDHTQDEVTKILTVEKLFTENEVNEMGGPFSGYVVVSTDGVGYWTSSDAMFLGFEVGKTYCVKVKPNLPQGPMIMLNLGITNNNCTLDDAPH